MSGGDAVRRVDWRFVVGRPRLGPDGQPAGGVVPAGADPAELRAAAERVPPGGWLWAPLPRHRRHRLAPLMAELRSAGLTDVRRYWLWPSADAPTRIVPLDERPALELSIRRQLESRRAGAALSRVAASTRLARLAARDVAVAAGRGDGASSRLLGWLEGNRDRFGLSPGDGPLSGLFLTPRFRASASVIVLVTAGRSPAPRLVVKLPRLTDDDQGLAAEATGLEAAAGRGLDADGSAPRLLALERPAELDGWPVLVETALTGRALRPEVVRRSPAKAMAAVEAWLRPLARGAEAGPGAERMGRLVATPLAPVAALGAAEADLVARTLAVLRPLEGAVLPVALEHGDLSHPNVVLRRSSEVGVVDWERAEPAGLPLQDLTFFLAYVAGARHRARTPADHEAAVRADEARITGAVLVHAGEIGVPETLVPLLVLACWARATADAWARAGGDDAAWLRGSRVMRLWRRALAVAEDEREGAACASST